MPKKHVFKYNIGYQFLNYEIIGHIVHQRTSGKKNYLYRIRCLRCGSVIERNECDIGKDIKCRACMRNMEYSKFNIGDIINGLEILDKVPILREKYHTVMRCYLCRCIKDGYVSLHSEDNLIKGKGCPVCAGIVIMRGVNDINTVAPWVGDLLENKEDGYKYGIGSKIKLRFRCPYCGTLTEPTQIYNIYQSCHVVCRQCGDNISMPEKIMYGILSKINVDFRYQKKFDWSCGKYYDFYIPSKNMIIETHGEQHYRDKINFWESLDSVQSNDAFKQKIAESNGIKKYIIIDCSVSDYSILFDRCTHALSEYFDIQILNKHSIIMGSMKSLCIKAGDIWNQGNYNISTLSAFLHVDDSTVRRYLKNLTRLGYFNVPYPIKNDINGGK